MQMVEPRGAAWLVLQSEQVIVPFWLEYFPARQFVQAVVPSVEEPQNVPSVHCVHAVDAPEPAR